MIITITIPDNLIQMLRDIIDLLKNLLVIFGGIAAVVKITPTLPKDHVLLPLIKFLGRLSNDMSDNETTRNGGQK